MTTSRSTTTPKGGFTLLEVLIATVAFAIVLAAINAVFYAALRLRNRTAESLEQSLPVRRTVEVIKNDLAQLVLPGGTLAGPLQTTATTNSVAGQASPDFYTSSGQIDDLWPWGDIQKVSYALIPSGANARGQDLVRAVTRNLLPVALAELPVQQWLMSGVDAVRFAYYDGTQWRETWDSQNPDPLTGETNTLPVAIKVEIHLVAGEGAARPANPAPIEVITPILARARTTQETGGTP